MCRIIKIYFCCVEHLYFFMLCDPRDRSQVLQHTLGMTYDHKEQTQKEIRIQVKIYDMYPFYTYIIIIVQSSTKH